MMAVILAGGEGTRLRPLTDNRPKPFVPVTGRPCVEYVIRSLVSAGFDKQIVTTGYKAMDIFDGIGDGNQWGASILYSYETEPVGTAGAVKKVERYLDGTFIVASGDVLADVDIGDLVRFHKEKGAVATMALTEVEEPTEFGIVGLDDQGRIRRFKEKPTPEEVFSNLINAGIYVLEPEVLELIPKDRMFDFSKNVYPQVLERHGERLFGRAIEGLWIDIGRPADLLTANFELVRKRGRKTVIDGREFPGPIMIDGNVDISKDAVIDGPCFFGDRTKVTGKSTLKSAALYENSIVEEASLESSMVLEGGKISRGARLVNTIVGSGGVVGPGKVLRNEVVGDGVTV